MIVYIIYNELKELVPTDLSTEQGKGYKIEVFVDSDDQDTEQVTHISKQDFLYNIYISYPYILVVYVYDAW